MSCTKIITILAVVTAGIVAVIVLRPLFRDAFSYTDEYHPCEFKVLAEGFTDKGIELIITVPPESIYYCPGATYKKLNGTISFSVVRTQIDSKPIVDVIAERRSDGSLLLLFPLDHEDIADGRKIELKDSSGRLRGAWSIPLEKKQAEQVVAPDH